MITKFFFLTKFIKFPTKDSPEILKCAVHDLTSLNHVGPT